jgi:hypothetical protein
MAEASSPRTRHRSGLRVQSANGNVGFEPEEAFGRQTLLSLTRLRDPIGILSVYVRADPERRADRRSGWDAGVRNELRALRRRMNLEAPRPRRVAFAEGLDALESALPVLFDRTETGRGWAIFARIADGDVCRLAVPTPFADLVVFGETVFVLPLIDALEAGRPAGIVTVSRSGVRMLDWRFGEAEEVEWLGFDEETAGWREMKGPAAANPALAQQTAPQRDRYERRVDDRRRRRLASAGARLGVLAAKRGWDRVLLAGDARLIQSLWETASGTHELEPILIDRGLEGLPADELAAEVAPELDAANRRRERLLAGRVLDGALGSGLGALGLSEVLGALAEGRVGHLLIELGREYPGASASDVRLVPDGEAAPGFSTSELDHEPDLTARMIARALETGARVTPVDGAAAALLAPAGGVAALLRW